MNYFDLILFILKYTPFWSVPLLLISFHFAYLYWLKDYKQIAFGWIFLSLFSLTITGIYLALGGPNGITHQLTHLFR